MPFATVSRIILQFKSQGKELTGPSEQPEFKEHFEKKNIVRQSLNKFINKILQRKYLIDNK